MNDERLHRLLLSLLFSMMIASSEPTGKYILAGMGAMNSLMMESPSPIPNPTPIGASQPAGNESFMDSPNINIYDDLRFNEKRRIEWNPDINTAPRIFCAWLELQCGNQNPQAKIFSMPDNPRNPEDMRTLFKITTQDRENPTVLVFSHCKNKQDCTAYRIPIEGALEKAATLSGPLTPNEKIRRDFLEECKIWHELLTGSGPVFARKP